MKREFSSLSQGFAAKVSIKNNNNYNNNYNYKHKQNYDINIDKMTEQNKKPKQPLNLMSILRKNSKKE